MNFLKFAFVTTGTVAFMTSTTLSFSQIGFSNTVNSGAQSTALGYGSLASGDRSFAAGQNAIATKKFSLSLGYFTQATADNAMTIGSGTTSGFPFILQNNTKNSLMIGFNSSLPTLFVGPSNGYGTVGKVGIGTTNLPLSLGMANLNNYTLYVKGGILTEELRVRTGWADYVFQEDYQLKPLKEVAHFIEENGHLPNVPSAKQVSEEGIEMGEITRIQQEKIEELTLYIIEMEEKFERELELIKAQLTSEEK